MENSRRALNGKGTMKLYLQRFAEDTAPETKPAAETVKTFTQEELDRIVGERLAKEKGKYEKDVAAKVAAARTEAEKLAVMSAEEKAAAAAKQREETLTAREREIARREMRATALEALANKGLPAALADTLDMTDAEKCSASIEVIEKAFRAAVEQGVKDRMRGDPPKGTGNTAPTGKRDELQAQYNKAVKEGRLADAVALKNKLFALDHEKK